MKARPKRLDRRLKALEAKSAEIGLNKCKMPLAAAMAISDADDERLDLERRKPTEGDDDYQLLIEAYESRQQKLGKIIADEVAAIIRIEGRHYTSREVFPEEGRLFTLMAIRRRIRRDGGKPLPREEELEHAVLRARRLVYEHSPKHLAERAAAERLQEQLREEILLAAGESQ